MNACLKPLVPLFCLPFLVVACDSSTDPSMGRDVAISISAEPSAAGGGMLTGASDLIQTHGDDTLILTRVAMVLSEIELERVEETECAAGVDEDDCEEFELGPILVELDLNGGVEQFISAMIPVGSYDELEIEIDTPDDDEDADVAFVAANPDFQDVSVRVEGTWNGESFVFVQNIDEEQELDLSPPLTIDGEGAATNLTLSLDVATWFVRSDGSLIDPRTALDGQPNAEAVEDNIRQSIEVFEDDDRDGEEDEN